MSRGQSDPGLTWVPGLAPGTLVRLAVFVPAYWVSAVAGVHLYGSPQAPSPFWLPDSVLLSALLLMRKDAWGIVLLLAFPIRLLAGALPGTPLWLLGTSILNDVAKALFTAWLLERVIRRPIQLNTLREFLVFAGIAGGLSPLLSALAGAAVRRTLGDPVWIVPFLRWFMGDALTQLVVTPAILYWCLGNYTHARARLKELAIVSVAMAALTSYAFVFTSATAPTLIYAPVPFLVWAAVRLRPFGTANTIAIVACIADLSVVSGSGIFSGSSPVDSVRSIQLLLLVLSLSLLSLSILAAEQESNVEEFKTLLDAAPITILMATDPAATRVIANRAGYDLLRAEAGSNLAASASDAARPFRIQRDGVDVPTAELPVQRAAAEGAPVFGDLSTIRFSDGTERHLIGNATPLIGEDGQPRGAVGAFLDITELRRAEQALRESEHRFRLVADTAPVMIWMAGQDMLCTFVNTGFLNFTGRSIEQELGDGWVAGVHPDDRDGCLAVYTTAFERRVPFEMEYRLRRADGLYRWVVVHGVPRFESTTFCGYIGTCLDVTDRRSAEKTLQELSGHLISAQETERVRIARELHDDLGQQLALLQISIERFGLALPGLSADAAEQLRAITRGTERMASDLHHCAHQLHPFKLDQIGLVSALGGLCREFSELHQLKVEFRHDDGASRLSADVSLCLFRIAQEALHNVVKHAKVPVATVELHARSGGLELTIDDPGAGFDSESSAPRSGMGLISMRERLRLVGGHLSIESRPSHGTRVSARVPMDSPYSLGATHDSTRQVRRVESA